MKNEIFFSDWGRIACLNEQHKAYLLTANNWQRMKQAIASWEPNWPSREMAADYKLQELNLRIECDRLWDLIPDKTDDLSKSH